MNFPMVFLFSFLFSLELWAQVPITQQDVTFGYNGAFGDGTSSVDVADVYATWSVTENNKIWLDADARFNFYTKKAFDTPAVGNNKYILGVGMPVYANEDRTEIVGLFITGGMVMDQGIDYSYMESLLNNPDDIETFRPTISPRIVFFNRQNRVDFRYGHIFLKGKNAHQFNARLVRDWGKFISGAKFNSFLNPATGNHFHDFVVSSEIKILDDRFRAGVQAGVMQNQFYYGFTVHGNWLKVQTE
ncbi:hypothetical protein N9N67_03130 [Bacteriovoracaceae bacterium]|nr:hypothetical protein [Bacteriovoracaceae bacterium]